MMIKVAEVLPKGEERKKGAKQVKIVASSDDGRLQYTVTLRKINRKIKIVEVAENGYYNLGGPRNWLPPAFFRAVIRRAWAILNEKPRVV
jgi:hypothetical protein